MTSTFSKLSAALADRYRIERELGGGGMSLVFLATETALQRAVVIKVVPPELLEGLSAERFAREVQLAARLQQANIVPVLTAGTADGLPWYAMPYVSGESLRARLARGTPLAQPEAFGILRDVARALAYSHEQGVVHRDIKPDNILLSGGTAVVADFGIAKALTASRTLDASGGTLATATGTLTSVGMSLGTPAYMAPEQAVGSDVDARADLYAWGVLAYELLAGAHPFAGRTSAQQLVAAHIAEVPAPIAGRQPELPAPLSEVVMRCLAKDPAQRPASAAELLAALDAAATPSGTGATAAARPTLERGRPIGRARVVGFVAGLTMLVAVAAAVAIRQRPTAAAQNIETLAVLPFVNVSGDPKDEYFADGITDELANALSKLPGLRLAGRSSSFAFKGKNVGAKEIGQQLDVAALIEGTVRRAGGRVRITVQLTSSADGKTLWQDSYENDKGDVFQVQDEVTTAIVAAVAPTLSGTTTSVTAVRSRGTRDSAAYDLYLQGRYFLARRDAASLDRAVALLHAAIARDATFARAHAGLGMVYAVMPSWNEKIDTDSVIGLAEQSARRALALDTTLVDVYSVLGTVRRRRGQLREAISFGRMATKVDPSDATAHQWLARSLNYVGDLEAARTEIGRAMMLEPLSNTIANIELEILLASDFDGVRKAAGRMIERDSLHYDAHSHLAIAEIFSGAPDRALGTIRKMDRMPHGIRGEHGLELFALAALGRWAEAERVREGIVKRTGEKITPMDDVLAALAFGDFTRAMDIIAASPDDLLVKRDWFPSPGCDPFLSPLRSDPRMIALLNRFGTTRCTKPVTWPIAPRALAPSAAKR